MKTTTERFSWSQIVGVFQFEQYTVELFGLIRFFEMLLLLTFSCSQQFLVLFGYQEGCEPNKSILEAFRCQDKGEVLRLLPHVHQPHLIEDLRWHSPRFTLLHHAAKCGWTDVCRTLVEDYQCNVEDTDADGCSVLHIACEAGHPSVVKYLLTLRSVSATASAKNYYGSTPMELVTENQQEIYSLFASHGN